MTKETQNSESSAKQREALPLTYNLTDSIATIAIDDGKVNALSLQML